MCSSLAVCLMTAGLCSSGFDLEQFLHRYLSSRAKTHSPEDCTVKASGKPFIFYAALDFFHLFSLGTNIQQWEF